LEARALFAGSQGGTVARADGNACGPLSARLDLTSYLGLNGFIVHFSIIPRLCSPVCNDLVEKPRFAFQFEPVELALGLMFAAWIT
jgi:hypothetical protein